MLENRNGSIIEDGRQLREFWTALQHHAPGSAESCGIVLDLSALQYGLQGDAFETTSVPFGRGIMGLHIHTRHRAPSRRIRSLETVFATVAGIRTISSSAESIIETR